MIRKISERSIDPRSLAAGASETWGKEKEERRVLWEKNSCLAQREAWWLGGDCGLESREASYRRLDEALLRKIYSIVPAQ